ncbi:MAG: hypothetical protein GY931_21795, partial [Maribacter sp.]|nr:hypothetical protein [Maribacter sp.]
TIRQVTTFSLQSITNVAIDAGLEYYGIDSDGKLGLTIKAVANEAVKYATDGAIDGLYKAESSGGSREDSSGASWYKKVPKPFTNKDGSRHVPNSGNPNRGLGYYGLEAGQPDKDGNYNTEDAIWKLMNAVNATGGINYKYPKNWPLIYHEATRGFEQALIVTFIGTATTGNLKKSPRGSLYVMFGFAFIDAFISAKNEYDRQGSLIRVPGMQSPWEVDPLWDGSVP